MNNDRYLFRGKRSDVAVGEKWAYGNLMTFEPSSLSSRSGYVIASAAERPRPRVFDYDDVDPATIGQCTGVKFDGALVFEGDICVDEDGGTVEIKWNGDGFAGEYASDGEQIPLMHFIYLKVIGNIHDNPELLEVQNK